MTKLDKPVKREVATRDGREIIVTLTQAGLVFREKGRRIEYGPFSYGKLFILAVEEEIARKKRERLTSGPAPVRRGAFAGRLRG